MNSTHALVKSGPQQLATRFAAYQKLTVRQRKRWSEILFSLEMKNSYDVFDDHGVAVLRVRELGEGVGSLLRRLLLGPFRPFSAQVSDLGTEEVVLELKRPFRFVFHRLEVRAADGELLGAIQKRWSWVRRIYDLQDAQGQVVGQLFGPVWKPWTFEIRQGNEVQGVICKRWSGLLKEAFSDADNFGVDLANLSDPSLKTLAFAATVLVDVVHFERAKT
ncbi:MAG: scramblase [Deltaproteobacteria bacterium]|nr:scramblase [Deltaproteobacteria bacterium]